MDRKILSYDPARVEDNASFNVTFKNDGFYNTSCIGKAITNEQKNIIGVIESVDDEFVFGKIWDKNVFEKINSRMISSISMEIRDTEQDDGSVTKEKLDRLIEHVKNQPYKEVKYGKTRNGAIVRL